MSTFNTDYKRMHWQNLDKDKAFEEYKVWPNLRVFQDMNFEFKDAGSGLTWAHAKVNYLDFVVQDKEKKGGDFEVTTTMVMER